MGYHADKAMEDSWSEEFRQEAIRNEIEERAKAIVEKYKMGIAVWKTQNGNEIPVIQMTNDHIHNSIKWLKRKPKNDISDAWIYILETELTKRQQQKQL